MLEAGLLENGPGKNCNGDTRLPADSKSTKKAGKTPRYMQVAGELREAVLAGKFDADHPFPTETELCHRYEVSRFTVREALRRLQHDGLIARRRGSGTVVQPASAHGGALHHPLSDTGDFLQYAQDTHIAFTPSGSGPLPSALSGHIAVKAAGKTAGKAGGEWTSFRGVRKHDGQPRPVAVTEAFFPESLADAVALLDLTKGNLFAQLEQLAGITVSKVTQTLHAITADTRIADDLKIAKGDPVLRIVRCYWNASGDIFEIAVSLHPGDDFAYAMHIGADG